MKPMTIKGRYNTAKVFATAIEDEAIKQIQTLLDQPFVEGENIAIMPDVHAGKGCTIGYTQTFYNKKLCPSLVGVDISCGVITCELGKIDIDLKALDEYIRANVPAGKNVHDGRIERFEDMKDLHCYRYLKDTKRLERSLGTLGGGNHFIELDKDEEGNVYLLIHTGSRNLGKQVAEYYQDLADKLCNQNHGEYLARRDELIARFKAEGRKADIQDALAALRKEYGERKENIPKDLAYLEGRHAEEYLEDMMICQSFAEENRLAIANTVRRFFGHDFSFKDWFDTVHNYISEDGILRKGSVRAVEGEMLIVPINMRDGALICTGKSNEEYNFSAPHGAGRLMSRAKARDTVSLSEFERAMEGIYSSSVCEGTLDESPFAYKSIDDIVPMLEPTVEIVKRIKPIYNFKAMD